MLEISIKPDILFTISSFPVTNSFLASLLVSTIILSAVLLVASRLKTIPGFMQLFIEQFLQFTRNFVQGVTGSKKVTARMYPLFTTLILFFVVSNLLGTFLPFLGAIRINDMPAYRAATADYGLVLSLTLVSFIIMQVVAVVSGGFFGYLGKFFNFKSPLDFVLGLLDIVGELAKIVSLSFRLFGNIFAGEVLMAVIISLVPYGAPLPFAMLGLLSGVVQAFVFPVLVLIFVNMAIAVKSENEATSNETAAESA